MNVTELHAGRELDALVAEKVMGWTEVHKSDWSYEWFGHSPNWPHPKIVMASPPQYSTDIAAAWQVVDKLRTDGWDMTLGQSARARHEPWECRLFLQEYKRVIGHGASAPLAICRAALAASAVTMA